MLSATLYTVLVCLVSCCCAHGLVPLLAWSNSDVLLESSLSYQTVHDVLSDVKVEDLRVAVLLKATKLSFDDIAKYGGVYGEKNAPLSTLQSSLSSSKSSLSTGVSGQPASDLITYLTFAMDTDPVFVSGVSQFPEFDSGRQYVLVVELPEGNEEETTFRTHDSILDEVQSFLTKSDIPYGIFYTSNRMNSRKSLLSFHKKRAVRTYTEDTNAEPKCFEVKDVYNLTCILFCFTNPLIYLSSDNETTVLGSGEEGIRYERGSCNSTDSLPEEFQMNKTFGFIMFKVEGNATDDEPPAKKSLVFIFENGTCGNQDNAENNGIGCGFWTMSLHAGDGPQDLMEFRRNRPNGNIYSTFSIPLSASYACGQNSLNSFVSVSNTSDASYSLSGIHVQAFSRLSINQNNEYVFSSTYHCQGYLDTTAWMGIVAVLLLMMIMYIAVVFAFSLPSIDTFDDPRNPTITIENLH